MKIITLYSFTDLMNLLNSKHHWIEPDGSPNGSPNNPESFIFIERIYKDNRKK